MITSSAEGRKATALTVVGSINEDVTLRVEDFPKPGETVLAHDVRRSPGGKGANQAAAAARLGGVVRMIGAVGADDAGERMLAALTDAGVDVEAVERSSAPTGEAHILVDASGENTIVVAAGANDSIRVPGTLDGAVLCQLEIPLGSVTAAAHAATGFFALNASPARRLPPTLLDRCDVVVVNETEYALMPELATHGLVVVTLGAAGAIAMASGVEVARASGRPADVVSTVGAGDAFCAAVVLCLAAGAAIQESLEVACAVGAAAVTSPDARPLLDELGAYR